MKLRSGKLIGEKPTLSTKIQTELRNTLQNLKEILKDNSDFFTALVEKSLLLGVEIDGHTVYRNAIDDFIWQEYPDLNRYDNRLELLSIVYQLGQLITLQDSRIRNKIIHKSEEYFSDLRDLVKEEVCSYEFIKCMKSYSESQR